MHDVGSRACRWFILYFVKLQFFPISETILIEKVHESDKSRLSLKLEISSLLIAYRSLLFDRSMNKNEILIIFRYVARLFEYGQRIKSPVSIKIFLVMNIHLLEHEINSSSPVIRFDLRIPSDPTIILSFSFQSHSLPYDHTEFHQIRRSVFLGDHHLPLAFYRNSNFLSVASG
jgi:hypothetical protein